MYPDLKDKVVMLTGAAGNLGQAATQYFDEAGCKLVLIDRSIELINQRLGEKETWLPLEADITNETAVNEAITKAFDYFARLDVLVNIAGGYAGGKKIYETDLETWDFMMNLNARTTFLMGKAFSKLLVEKEMQGSIINVGAKPGLSGTSNHAAYSASKSAVLRLTESMSEDLKGNGIRVNAIIPSTIDTPANRQSQPDADFSKWVTPESMANVLGFLASEVSRDISGALIPVYGR